MKLERSIIEWHQLSPEAMPSMDIVAALNAAKKDIITLAKLLCEAGYPRRGTEDETQEFYEYAEKVKTLISLEDAVGIQT